MGNSMDHLLFGPCLDEKDMDKLFLAIAKKIFGGDEEHADFQAWMQGDGSMIPQATGFDMVSLFMDHAKCKIKMRITATPLEKYDMFSRDPEALGLQEDDDRQSPLAFDESDGIDLVTHQVWYTVLLLSKIPPLPRDWAEDDDSPWNATTVIEVTAIMKTLLRVPEYKSPSAQDLEDNCNL